MIDLPNDEGGEGDERHPLLLTSMGVLALVVVVEGTKTVVKLFNRVSFQPMALSILSMTDDDIDQCCCLYSSICVVGRWILVNLLKKPERN